MRIKFIQKLIDKIRYEILADNKTELKPEQKLIIEKIKQYKTKFKHVEMKDKTALEDYEMRYTAKDPMGTVIKKNNVIYRTVYQESVNDFIQLYETGILQTLAEFNLIPKFELTDYYIDDNPIILKVETLDVVPPQYWTMEMIKEEAKLTLEIIEILDVFDYLLIDGHPWNVAFKNSKPIFFDFGSIIKKSHKEEKPRCAFLGILIYNIIPLIMHNLNKFWTKREILSIENNIQTEPSVNYLESYEVLSALKQFKNRKNKKILQRILRRKHALINSSDIDELFSENKKTKSLWGGYYGENQEGFVVERYEKVLNSIKRNTKDVNSFLDMAGNAGHFASYINKNTDIKKIVSIDYDENAVELGRILYKDEDMDFYVLNCMQHPLINVKEVAKYFKSDVVTALALTHHLLLTQKYDIDYVFNTIKQYSNKYVFIEFCPLGLFSHLLDKLPEVPEYYTTEWFEEHFKKFFKLLDKEVTNRVEYQGKIYDHRILFAGEIV